MLTYSKNLKLAEKSYNTKHSHKNQINIISAFSTTTKLPTATDAFYSSIKDIKTIRHFLDHFACEDMGFIFDRGFSSYKLLLELKAGRVHYVVPLKKNSKLLSDVFRAQGALVYRKRRWVFLSRFVRRGFCICLMIL
ncbi:MAG: transposase [Nitrososphaerota archaeon]|nr:transposase [Nitrososphaerota archaeon]